MRLLPRCAALGLRFAGFGLVCVLAACGPSIHLDGSRTPTGPTTTPGPPSARSEASASKGHDIIASIRDGDRALTPGEIHTIVNSPPRAPTPLQAHRLRSGATTLTILTFDGHTHHLAVIDNERGPGTGATTSQAAANSAKALAAINAGFFTPEGKPLGLVIEDGTKFGALNSSSLGAGIYSYRAGAASLIRRTSWSRPSSPQHLLQSGPFLVDSKAAVSGLSNSRPRPRSFLLWDGQDGWAIGHAGSATLADLASTLASQPVPGFTIKSALNLDGGTSSDLWIASTVTGGPASTRRFWNKPVRNYLVLQANRP